MVTGQWKVVGSRPGVAGAQERVETLSDEQLLDWFLNRDDGSAEVAFRAIVIRHGPMVLGVCRHILNQLQDAEDAFQATFLVLARKAGTIRDRRVLARWLYEVAYRIAMRAEQAGSDVGRMKGRAERWPRRSRATTRAGSSFGRCCTRRSIVYPRNTGCRSSSVTSKARPTRKRRNCSDGPWAPSRGGSREPATCSGRG